MSERGASNLPNEVDPDNLKVRVADLERRLEESIAFGLATSGSLLESIMVIESLLRKIDRIAPDAQSHHLQTDKDITPDREVLERAWNRAFKQFEKYDHAG